MIKLLTILLIIDAILIGMTAFPFLTTYGNVDCDDYALASYNYLERLGFEPVIKHYPGHVWVETSWFGYDNGMFFFGSMGGNEVTMEYLLYQVERDK